MQRDTPSYIREIVEELIRSQTGHEDQHTRTEQERNAPPSPMSDSVVEGLMRVFGYNNSPDNSETIRRYLDKIGDRVRPRFTGVVGATSSGRRTAPRHQNDEYRGTALADLQARCKMLESMHTDMQHIIRKLQQDIQTAEQMDTVHHNDPQDTEDSPIKTVSIGIIPDNVTEQAWPLLHKRLQDSGVSVPNVETWITLETYQSITLRTEQLSAAVGMKSRRTTTNP